ncbi:hypothetical protein JYT28_00295 [Desulfobulbus sp. AH-315-M07]|nr:hypothetical protein [Desulfobulbus sp. AH-315-M07]
MTVFRTTSLVALLLMVGCGSTAPVNNDDDDGGSVVPEPDPITIALLGGGTHDILNVELTVVGTGDGDGLNLPRDLAFNPLVPGELWVVNTTDESMVVFNNAGDPGQTSQKYVNAGGSEHFFARPAGIAFSSNGNFATIHETDMTTQPSTPADFMGPTMWTSNRSVFDGGHAGHLDMLHNSPNGVGIAWQMENTFWVFDGYHGAITRYQFNSDHGPGGSDHSDGVKTRFVEGLVARTPAVTGGLLFDNLTGYIYICDTGNNRIAVLDPNTGTPGGAMGPNYDEGTTQTAVNGAVINTFIDPALNTLGGVPAAHFWPSGIAIWGEGETRYMYVSDVQTGTVYGYSMVTGELVDYLPLGLPDGSLMGIEFDSQGRLYAADSMGNRILRIAALPVIPDPGTGTGM